MVEEVSILGINGHQPDKGAEIVARPIQFFIDQNERKELIRASLKKAADAVHGVLVEDEDLLDLVTYIVEYPHAVTCSFKESFLEIQKSTSSPEELNGVPKLRTVVSFPFLTNFDQSLAPSPPLDV